jgi:1-acyl-sn-glycerol-3-phosphate acyltransferase
MTPATPPTLRSGARAPAEHFDPNPEKKLSLRLMKAADVIFCRIYHRLTVLAPPHLPSKGAAILICNHTSGLDPVMIQSVCKRVIVWMMAKEYYEIKPLKPFFKMLEAIPVDRGSRDTAAMRLALRALQDGRILGIFPEGRISTTRGTMLPFQSGVAQLAIKTGVPIYPAFLDGTQYGVSDMAAAFVGRQESTLRFGGAITIDRSSASRESLEAATATLHSAVESLRKPKNV